MGNKEYGRQIQPLLEDKSVEDKPSLLDTQEWLPQNPGLQADNNDSVPEDASQTQSTTNNTTESPSSSLLPINNDKDSDEKTEGRSLKSVISKIKEFYKNHKLLCKVLVSVLSFILIVLLWVVMGLFFVYILLHSFSLLFGINNEAFIKDEEIKEMKIQDLQAVAEDYNICYKNGNGGWWANFWEGIAPGIQSGCEALKVVNQIAEAFEMIYEKYDLRVSRGLIISTLIYTYSYQDDNTTASPADPFTILEDMAKNGKLSRSDVIDIVYNMIFHEHYYTVNESSCSTEKIENGYKCDFTKYENYYFDREKYKIFLIYGAASANLYESASNFSNSAYSSDCVCAPNSIRKRELENDYSTYESFKIDKENPDVIKSLNRDTAVIKEFTKLTGEIFSLGDLKDPFGRTVGSFWYFNISDFKSKITSFINELSGNFNETFGIDIGKLPTVDEISYTNGFIYENFEDENMNMYQNVEENIIKKMETIISYEKTIEDTAFPGEYGSLGQASESSIIEEQSDDCYEELEAKDRENICKAEPLENQEDNPIIDNPGEDINYASDDEINHFINTANAYHGKTREQFKSVAKKYSGYTIGDNTSWCAIFVSSIINESKINKYKGFKSQSVSEFMEKMINSNRFYHSEYWYKESKKYKDPSGPQPGDIVFFAKKSCGYTGNGNLPSKSADCYRHIGIVTDVKGGFIYYTHGNTSSCSKTNGVCAGTKERINDPYIIGYGR